MASGAWPLAVAAILAIVAALMSGRHESDAVVSCAPLARPLACWRTAGPRTADPHPPPTTGIGVSRDVFGARCVRVRDGSVIISLPTTGMGVSRCEIWVPLTTASWVVRQRVLARRLRRRRQAIWISLVRPRRRKTPRPGVRVAAGSMRDPKGSPSCGLAGWRSTASAGKKPRERAAIRRGHGMPQGRHDHDDIGSRLEAFDQRCLTVNPSPSTSSIETSQDPLSRSSAAAAYRSSGRRRMRRPAHAA